MCIRDGSYTGLGQSVKEQGYDNLAKGFTDSAGVVQGRNTVTVDPTLFEKKYPDNVFLNSGIQADNTGGYGNAVESLRKDYTGGFNSASDSGDVKGRIGMNTEYSVIHVSGKKALSELHQAELKEAERIGTKPERQNLAGHLYKPDGADAQP